MSSTIVLDLETQKTFQEVGGRNMADLGVSLLGVYFYDTDTFHGFREHDIPEFEQYLLDHQPTIIGFNSIFFDLPVLQPYCRRIQLAKLPHVDIMQEVVRVLKVRLKLETIAQATLLTGKSGHGLDAIRYYRNNEWEKLETYCLDDVRITRDIYEYGKSHGCIFYENNAELRPIAVQWSDAPTIRTRLEKAISAHEQVTLDILERGEKGVKRTPLIVDLRTVAGETVRGFLPDLHEERLIPIKCIVQVRENAVRSMHQATLL